VDSYISHLASDSDPRFTACGSAWQGWQEPDDAPRDFGPGGPLPPHDPPRPHQDKIRFCGACQLKARDG
jgi:hypothetical protein